MASPFSFKAPAVDEDGNEVMVDVYETRPTFTSIASGVRGRVGRGSRNYKIGSEELSATTDADGLKLTSLDTGKVYRLKT